MQCPLRTHRALPTWSPGHCRSRPLGRTRPRPQPPADSTANRASTADMRRTLRPSTRLLPVSGQHARSAVRSPALVNPLDRRSRGGHQRPTRRGHRTHLPDTRSSGSPGAADACCRGKVPPTLQQPSWPDSALPPVSAAITTGSSVRQAQHRTVRQHAASGHFRPLVRPPSITPRRLPPERADHTKHKAAGVGGQGQCRGTGRPRGRKLLTLPLSSAVPGPPGTQVGAKDATTSATTSTSTQT